VDKIREIQEKKLKDEEKKEINDYKTYVLCCFLLKNPFKIGHYIVFMKEHLKMSLKQFL
jgi:diadenosine tetraphosphate (Ap4A) HIT family hydrolase